MLTILNCSRYSGWNSTEYVLVNNAGIGDRDLLEDVMVENMTEAFAIHTTGPLMLTQSLLPLLKRAASHASNKPLGWERAAIINISIHQFLPMVPQ